MDDHVVGIAGYEERLDVRVEYIDPIEQCLAADMRHYYVCQQQIDRLAGMLARQAQRIRAVDRLQHRIAPSAEHTRHQSSYGRLIFRQQHSFDSARKIVCVVEPCSGYGWRIDLRQMDFKGRTVPWLAIDPDVAPMLFDDTIAG